MNKGHAKMLRKDKRLLTEMRKRSTRKQHLILVAFFLLTFFVVPEESRVYGVAKAYINNHELDLVEKDVLAVYIKPILESVSVGCEPLGQAGPFNVEIQTDHTDNLFGTKTGIWVRFESEGRYNLTINFQSNETWDYTIGVYTQNFDFYEDYYGKNVKTYGYFLELPQGTPSTRPPGNSTIIITVDIHGFSSSIFSIELPTPVNSVLLVTAAGFIVYFNVFLLLDTYFKNKKEMVSNRRWFLSGIVFIISALAIYQLYTFTTFTLSGGL
ncbi:MAG: hypothetical protein OEZ24_00030 [Candidatus Bathyarchaeota archaeon]|nr:hypothetical protein [Candidatus Bathyarchaeota archaeon]